MGPVAPRSFLPDTRPRAKVRENLVPSGHATDFDGVSTMPGRPKGMAMKVAELETAVLGVYRQLEAAIPAIHKGRRKDGSSASNSPWVNVHRAGCDLVIAAKELGDHYRKTTGDQEPGPILTELGAACLGGIRRRCGGSGPNSEGTERLRAEAQLAAAELPDRAGIKSEIEWVGANMHHPHPAFDKAPSRSAISLWLDVKSDERLRREFWTILLGKRLTPGEPKQRKTRFEEDQTNNMEEREEEVMRRLFGKS